MIKLILSLSMAAFIVHHVTGNNYIWSPHSGGDGVSFFDEANWTDSATGNTVANGLIEPDIGVDQSLYIRSGNPVASGNLLMGSGELVVSHAELTMGGAGIDMGATNKSLQIIDGAVQADFIHNGSITLVGHSQLTISGTSDPLLNSSIQLQSVDSAVYLTGYLPSDAGDPAIAGKFSAGPGTGGLSIQQYYNGTIVRVKPVSEIAIKAFDQPDLQGTQLNFSPAFHGPDGLGLTFYWDDWQTPGTESPVPMGQDPVNADYDLAYEYGIQPWGDRLDSQTSDRFHYTYRTLDGDGEIVAKVDEVSESSGADVWAMAGLMIREDLSQGARHAFVFQRPDYQVGFISRSTVGGLSSVASLAGGTSSPKWLKLVRNGNTFTASYATNSASGPWTQLASQSIQMPSTVLVGLAAASNKNIRRADVRLTGLSLLEGGVSVSPTNEIGVFSASADIQEVWQYDNQIRSFLLKKGYMVTLSTKAAGQGTSKVYMATEKDLLVNLPPGLDQQVSWMRVLPWRWQVKKGWGGQRSQAQTLGARWNYEWEPTGGSNTDTEFVPMIKGRTQDKEFRWEQVRRRGGQTHHLGFNEPEAQNQGKLTVDQCINLWPKCLQLGLRLGSIARTDGQNGSNFLQEFITKADAKGYRVDFISNHSYKGTISGHKGVVEGDYALYGRPIWLSEFSIFYDQLDDSARMAFLEEFIPWLESTPYVERYAHFSGLLTNDVLNQFGDYYKSVISNPAYQAPDSNDWCSVTISSPVADQLTADVSLDPSVISHVEFFVDDQSVGTDFSAPFSLTLPENLSQLQTAYAVVHTTLGEQQSSPALPVALLDYPPAAPSGLAMIPGDNQAYLYWTANTEPDLDSYRLLRSTTFGGPYAPLASDIQASSYLDATVLNGSTYYYVVQAVDINSNASAESDPASGTPFEGGDSDGDGKDNISEFIAGTDSSDPNSFFSISSVEWRVPGVGNILNWTSMSGRVYTVEWSSDLVEWAILDDNLPFPVNSYTDTVQGTGSRIFYRLQVRLE